MFIVVVFSVVVAWGKNICLKGQISMEKDEILKTRKGDTGNVESRWTVYLTEARVTQNEFHDSSSSCGSRTMIQISASRNSQVLHQSTALQSMSESSSLKCRKEVIHG